MSGDETFSMYVTLATWGLMVLGAIKIFGIRRVLWGVALLVVFAFVIAFRTLGAIAGSRRY